MQTSATESLAIAPLDIQLETIGNDGIDAIIFGEKLTQEKFPADLYIPPQALRVFLEAFTGPLDLLLYLIKAQNIDILNIPIAKITAQYMEYIAMMRELNFELAAEYLLMAAMLAEIKSKLLLPARRIDGSEADSDADPRAELVRKLREYERYKQATDSLDKLPRLERDIFATEVELPPVKIERALPKVVLQDLMAAFKEVMQRAASYKHHQIKLENLSVRERMSHILERLTSNQAMRFADFFQVKEGKLGVIVTFLALLELLRQEIINIVQNEPFGIMYLEKK